MIDFQTYVSNRAFMVEGDQDSLAGAPEGDVAQPKPMKMHPSATKQLTDPGQELASHMGNQQDAIGIFEKKLAKLIGMAEKMKSYTAVSAYDVARGGNRIADPNNPQGTYQSPFGQGEEEPEAMAAAFGQTPTWNKQAAADSVKQRMAQKAQQRQKQRQV